MSRYERKAGETWPEYVSRASRARVRGCGREPLTVSDDAVTRYFQHLCTDADANPQRAAFMALLDVGAVTRDDEAEMMRP